MFSVVEPPEDRPLRIFSVAPDNAERQGRFGTKSNESPFFAFTTRHYPGRFPFSNRGRDLLPRKKFFVNRSRLDFSSPPQLRPKKGFLPQALFRPRSSLPVLDGRFCHITRLPIGGRAGRVFRRRVECGV